MNSEERKKCLAEIEGYKAKLKIDGDPSQSGLTNNYRLLADLESARERIGSILVGAIDDVAKMEGVILDVKHVHKIKKAQEMNKDTIKILKSADLRETAIDTLLQRDLELIKNAEKDLVDAKAFLSGVEIGYADLKRAKETMELQVDIFGHMRGIGEIRRGSSPEHRGELEGKTRLVP